MLLLYQALVVAFIAAWGKFWGAYGSFAQFLGGFDIVILALLLGVNPVQAVIVNYTVALAFFGVMQIGGVLPQDTGYGGLIGTSIALILGQTGAVAVAIAVPISMLAVIIWNLLKFWFTANVEVFEKHVANRDEKRFTRLWWLQIAVYLGSYAIIAFLGILLGTNGIKALIDMIPPIFLKALVVAAGMLPAVGMAMLLKYVWNNSYIPYFIAGFALAAYLKLPIMGVTLFALVFGLIVFFLDQELRKVRVKAAPAGGLSDNDEEGFFDE
ncbi:PTS sugar transporter subunit IIC [Sporolactobacillus shoreicorticis]|uniref:PTS mannose/fructose/sorbose/N-acetylgalactosamine transporter subunit IIC n=1 Tax=Sporolactobacillus shoreicorticis TaxID=1923877 RepID=A0ABW5S1T8_9BACL|nr:PTS sugar transporter subunit IIC [Sporolactobacillus shoreicorticis]MCO7124706.1 PTS sugar transporter subunit IIC [Sporolactobacillus shoreicorticis]